MVVHRMAFPVAMGGTGKGANLQQLFAVGYAACFNSSIEHVAAAARTLVGPITVLAEVGIGPAGEVYALTVKLTVRIDGVTREVAETLIENAGRQSHKND